MVYNPDVVDGWGFEGDFSYKNSGMFGTQIDIDIERDEQLEEDSNELHPLYFSPDDLPGFDITDIEIDRGDGLVNDYELGAKKAFYTGDPFNDIRPLKEMECVYAGEYCYVWIDADTEPALVEGIGEVFDEKIYPTELELFGRPRFVTDEGGKVNILFGYMEPDNDGGYIGGYFSPSDTYSTAERGSYNLPYNTDHAIVHINTFKLLIGDFDGTLSTLAHELQHLIMFSENIKTLAGTWINEAMSGYIQEYIFPGEILNSRPDQYNNSDTIRKGGSLYKFDNNDPDIGRYGSVFYFSQYLENVAGENVFKSFHDYWRNSYSETLCDTEAIANSIPENVRNQVMSSVVYPEDIEFENENHELVSKLTLDFYLNTLNNKNGINGFDTIKPGQILYNTINETNIEAGGRVVVAVKNGEFTFPEDSNSGLIYVALNADFEPIGYAYH